MILRFALLGISIFSITLAGCSNPEYTTRAKDRIAKVKKNVSPEGASGSKKSDASQAANSTAWQILREKSKNRANENASPGHSFSNALSKSTCSSVINAADA